MTDETAAAPTAEAAATETPVPEAPVPEAGDVAAPDGPATSVAEPCPNCGAPHALDALFCEECAFDFTGGRATSELRSGAAHGRPWVPVDPVTAQSGSESPLDVGWTGPVSRQVTPLTAPVAPEPTGATCTACGEGHYEDGYCDVCGSKQRDPRDHYTEEPAPWLAGVCDIGLRHSRNEDAMALHADAEPLSFGVLVVCDGVSNSTDSHIASLAASRAARDVLDDPVAVGMGTRTAVIASIEQRLAAAVEAARKAVVDTTADRQVESPPSCTFVAALVDRGVAVVGNVGDSRAYWVPDDPARPGRQLTRDDSFAAEQMAAGMPREEAETSPGAHAITRWLGLDSPDDLTPHTSVLDLDHDGWLLVCSDGLWNYCSDAVALQALVHESVTGLGAAGRHPASLARALTDWANAQGGMDNITVTLARVGVVDPAPASPVAPVEASEPPTPVPGASAEPGATEAPGIPAVGGPPPPAGPPPGYSAPTAPPPAGPPVIPPAGPPPEPATPAGASDPAAPTAPTAPAAPPPLVPPLPSPTTSDDEGKDTP